jgi:hypothetical protein
MVLKHVRRRQIRYAEAHFDGHGFAAPPPVGWADPPTAGLSENK